MPLPLVDFRRKKFVLMQSKANIERNIRQAKILYGTGKLMLRVHTFGKR